MLSYMLSLVKLKLCRVVHQGSVSNRYVLYGVCVYNVWVSCSYSDMHKNCKIFPMIFTRKRDKIKHRIKYSQKAIS